MCEGVCLGDVGSSLCMVCVWFERSISLFVVKISLSPAVCVVFGVGVRGGLFQVSGMTRGVCVEIWSVHGGCAGVWVCVGVCGVWMRMCLCVCVSACSCACLRVCVSACVCVSVCLCCCLMALVFFGVVCLRCVSID
jgi:hypothetical protein